MKHLIAIVTVLLLAGKQLSAQNPYIQHYTTVDGLPSNMVYQVYQDSRKFIWFATDAGVARYDGSRFTFYRKSDGLGCNEVIRIREDSFGRIWFFNLNATLNFYFHNAIFNGTNTPFLDSLACKEFFRDFYEDEGKSICFYYNHQRDIFVLDHENNVKKYKLPSIHPGVLPADTVKPLPMEGMVIRYMSKPATGGFHLWTRMGLFTLNNLGQKPTLVSDAFVIKEVFPVSKYSRYIVGVPKGRQQFEIRKCSDETLLDAISPPIRSNSELISAVMEDVDGFLWISTFDQGVFCYKNNKLIRHFDIKEAQAIIQDHENNIWISSMKDGVYKISPNINQHVQYENSRFFNSGVLSLDSDISNGVWCTSRNSVFLLRDKWLYTSDFWKEESSFNQVVRLKGNTLLVGEKSTRQYALEGIIIDHTKKKVRFDHVSVFPEPFKKIAFDRRRDKLSTFGHFYLLFLKSDQPLRNIKMVDIGERIYNTFYNSRDELIVNAKKNYHFKNDKLVVCEALSCFDNKIITGHLILNDTTELFNIEGDSLLLLSGRQWFNLTSAFALPVDLQIKYLAYHYPTLFIATTRNIYLCENPLNMPGNKTVQLKPVDINFRNIHDILFNNGLLYIASDDGLTAIPYGSINSIKTNSPIPYFQSIQINDKEEAVDRKEITLSGHNRIQIVFSCISYSSSPVLFSYMLAGNDNKWTTGTGTNVVYQDLPKGEYVFKLKVRKPTSPWSEPVEYRVTIRATLWQNPLFYVLLSVLMAGLFSLLVIRRKNIQIRRRETDHQIITLEQKALQSMMNPHFIFNALGSIQNYLLQNKSGEAGLYLSQFARLIRQNLSSINSAMINLDEEIDRLKNYLDLERLRMEVKFEYFIEFAEGVEEDELRIPSMVIQPFVENAVWHGISAIEGKGMIRISFALVTDKVLKITIEDNGIGIRQSSAYASKNENHLHLGMEMTRKRLEIIGKRMNIRCSVTTSEVSPGSPNPGTRVIIVVPVSYGNADI